MGRTTFPRNRCRARCPVRLDDALENRVALGHRLLLYGLHLVFLNEVAIGEYGATNQFGVSNDGHCGSKVISNNIILVIVPFCGAEDVAKLAYLCTEVCGAEV